MSSTHPYPHGIYQGTLPSIPSTTPKFPSLPQVSQVSLNQAIHPFPCYIINIRHLLHMQNVLDNEFHSLFQMGFESNSANDSLGPNGNLQKFV